MLGRDWGQVNLEGRSLLSHHFGPLRALRTTRITVVRKGSLRGYRKFLNLRGQELQKKPVSKVQVVDRPIVGFECGRLQTHRKVLGSIPTAPTNHPSDW
jgi:hypothetical protein